MSTTKCDDKSKETEIEYFETAEGESLALTVNPTGLVTIWAVKIDKRTTLGSLAVSGLTAKEASSKSKGFWGNLWDKIKKVANDIIDAVTFPIGPLNCRPSGQVGFQGGLLSSLTLGISCR